MNVDYDKANQVEYIKMVDGQIIFKGDYNSRDGKSTHILNMFPRLVAELKEIHKYDFYNVDYHLGGLI